MFKARLQFMIQTAMKFNFFYRFFGHLFLQGTLSYEFMHKVFFHLLRQRRDIYIETLCALLSSTGKRYSIQTSKYSKPEHVSKEVSTYNPALLSL